MPWNRAAVCCLLILAGASPLSSQVAGDSLLTLGVQWTLPPGALPESRAVWVKLPNGYENGADRYDVVYVLDAHGLFPIAVGLTSWLSAVGSIPPVIVVGIPSVSPADRGRNFTPIVDESRRERFPDAGGATKFLRFLSDEAIPAVDRRYRTTTRRLLIGHSLAGLFALHTLATRPDLFDGIVAISPTLGWADGHTLVTLEQSLAHVPDERFVFASVGNEPGSYADGLSRLEALLQSARPRWSRHMIRFPTESHVTTVAPAIHAALRARYDSTGAQ